MCPFSSGWLRPIGDLAFTETRSILPCHHPHADEREALKLCMRHPGSVTAVTSDTCAELRPCESTETTVMLDYKLLPRTPEIV